MRPAVLRPLALSLVACGVAWAPAHAQMGQGVDIPTSGPTSGATMAVDRNAQRPDRAWWPARYLGDETLPLLERGARGTSQLTGAEQPWSYGHFKTSTCLLGVRGNHEFSPLEKHDSVIADRDAENVQGLQAANPKAASWEANPDNFHNTSLVQVEGQAEQHLKDVTERMTEEQVKLTESGGSRPQPGGGEPAVVYNGREYKPITYQAQSYKDAQNRDRPIEVYFFPSQGGANGQQNWGKFVRDPAQSHPDQTGATVWFCDWVQAGGRWEYRQTQVAVSAVQIRAGNQAAQAGTPGRFSIESGGKTYENLTYERSAQDQFFQGAYISLESWYYPAELDAQAQRLARPGQKYWNRFTRVPARGDTRMPVGGKPIWFHVKWEVRGRTEGVAWDGHCNGFACASLLFKEPFPAAERQGAGQGTVHQGNLVFPLRHSKALRLKAQTAPQANRDNLAYDLVDARQIVFTNRDMKALAIELASSVDVGFAYPATGGAAAGVYDREDGGTRVFEGTADDHRSWEDVKGHHMHRILIDTIQGQKRGVVLDVSPGEAVWNRPAYKYEWVIESVGTNPKSYNIRGTVTMADYSQDDDQKGLIPNQETYRFKILLDEKNRVINSEWPDRRANHPDFMYAPLRLTPSYFDPFSGRPSCNSNIKREFALGEVLKDKLREWAR